MTSKPFETLLALPLVAGKGVKGGGEDRRWEDARKGTVGRRSWWLAKQGQVQVVHAYVLMPRHRTMKDFMLILGVAWVLRLGPFYTWGIQG